ncbi:hydantoinase B/oxoprolinase family protein [Streptomyces broussonetiae]|uniref:Hydantoinase B/oxoprolinase family protein n=1 Tax=Streptomyces broussonetiae TaxID=2686304 RepID=A0ABV5EAM9_9ACTN
MTRPVSDPIGLEVRWDRLAAATDEAAATMLRTAFSTIIRESNDYTVVLMDRAGRTMAESRAGIPAFAALMSSLTELVLRRFPLDEWQDGDSVITNDPWIATGHLPDIAMISPVFHQGRLVAFTGTVAHSPDIGGTPSTSATELISEGILIPRCGCSGPARRARAGPRPGRCRPYPGRLRVDVPGGVRPLSRRRRGGRELAAVDAAAR